MIGGNPPIATRDVRPLAVMGVATLVATLLVWLGVSRPDLVHLQVPVSPLGLALAALGVAATLVTLRRPEIGLHLLLTVVFLNLSEALVRWHDLPSVLHLLAVPFAGIAWIASSGESRRSARGVLTFLLLAYGVVLLASTTYAKDPTLADARLIETLKAIILYVTLVLLLSSTAAIRRGIWTVVGAGALLAALGVWQTAAGRFDLEFGGLARIKQAHIYGTFFEPRIAGPLGDPNFFAQILVMVVPLALSLAWTDASRVRRAFALGCAGLLVIGIGLTYSRGGALALGAVLALSLGGRRIDLRRAAIAAAAIALVLVLLPPDFTRRLRTVVQVVPGSEETIHPDTSFEQRKLWTRVAWHIFLDHPVLGVGGANYAAHYNEYADAIGSVNREFEQAGMARYPHSLYLEIAAETGLLGAAVFGCVLFVCFAYLSRARRAFLAAQDARMADLSRAVAIALAGYLVSSLFLHGDFQRYLYLLFALAAALDGAARTRPAGGKVVKAWSRDEMERAAPARRSPVPVRRAIAVVVSRFPKVTETFILREIEELERQGQPVRLVPLLRERPPVVHREAEAWLPRALFTPFVSPAILAANARTFARQPGRYILLLCRIVLGSVRSPNVLGRTLALFPKSVYLAERLHRGGIRHVHAHYATHPATVAFVISSLTPITFSFTVHAHDLFVGWRRPLLGSKVRSARFIRVISAFNQCFLRALRPESADKIHVIHVGIDPGPDRPDPSPSASSGPGSPRLLCVAALQPYKGIPVLLEACARLKAAGHPFHCDIVGDGWLRKSLEDMLARMQLGDRVRLLGALRQDQVAALLAQASMVVLPSIVARDGQMEGVPVSLMEAMAAERPVIASAISGIPELIDHGVNGLMVEAGNSEALAAAIATLLADEARRREMGRRGREKVLRAFRLDACTAALLQKLDQSNPPPALGGELCEIAGRAGFRAHRLGIRRVHGRRDSQVIELIAADGGQVHELILKRQRSRPGESRPAVERARDECEALARLGRCLPQGHTDGPGISLQVPRPFALRTSDASILMERCRGVQLDDLIRRSRCDGDSQAWTSLERAVGCTGLWLRRLQEATRHPDATAATRAWDDVIERAHRVLAACEGRGLSRRKAARIRQRLRDIQAGPPPGVFLVACHGDFSPGNIFATASSITVIDFEGFHEGLPWADAAYFLAHLELYFAYRWRSARFARLQAAFREGFGMAADPVGYELFRTVAALTALTRIPASSWRAWPHARLLQRVAAEKAA